MADLMPTLVQCCRCSRQFPVRAQMNLGTGDKIPMLVVPGDVASVGEALEQATCQVCLGKTGPTDRGLYEGLKRFGLRDEEDTAPPSRKAIVVAPAVDHPTRIGITVVIASRPREVVIFDPLMGTSIEVQVQPVRGRRPHDSRRDDWRAPSSEPRLPRVLRESEQREPPVEIEHLTGRLDALPRNRAVLEVAAMVARVRDEDRRRERAEKFDKLLFWFRLALARIRKNAAKSEVWVLVEAFERKLGEAVSLDPHSHGKRGILAELGSSIDELEALCHEFYLGKEPLRLRHPEVVTIDAFEGGRRPQAWDEKGGKKPAFYQFEVIRTKNSLPVPNPPLPNGDEDPRPRIVYPDGGGYGPDYTVEHSRRGDRHQFDWELKPFSWAVLSLASWLGDHPDLQDCGLNISDLVCSFIEPTLMEEEDEPKLLANT